MAAGMPVLDVEDGVVLRLFKHLCKVEIEHGVVLAEQHHEPHRVGTDLVDHFAQRDEIAGAFRHPHLFAGTKEPHELNDLDVERGLAVAYGLDRRLHALDVAATIGSHDASAIALSLSPCSAASAWPTGTR